VDTIDNLCEEIVDCVNRTAPIVDEITEFKMIRTTNIRNYKVNFLDLRYVSQETFEVWTRRLLPRKGDIIFTREAPAGEAAIVDFDDKIFLGQRTMHFRPNLKKVSASYLLYQLMGSDVQRQINEMSSGSTVKHLSVPACKKFEIPLPPLPLQQKFAAIIENIEQQKQQAEAALAQSEALFQALLQKAFKGELQ
jgi:type I restriction enzyme S subunit